MNQILATQRERENRKSKKIKNSSTDIKKVIKVSCIIIISFGIVIAGEAIWNLIQNNSMPNIPDSIGNNIYTNNIAQDNNLNENANQNVANPNEDDDIEQYDTQINLAVVGNKLKITAKNANGLDNLIYRWNNGEDIQVYSEDEENTNIEVQVEIPIGRNTITIVATDLEDNQKVEECEIIGTTKPEITVSKDGNNLIINAVDAEEIVTVEFIVNDVKYRINVDDLMENELYKQIPGLTVLLSEANRIKELTYKQNLLQQGNNEITVTAENKYGTTATYKGQIQLD